MVSRFSLISWILCIGFPLIFCSKLDLIVLKSGNEVFEENTSTENLNGSWHNGGFILTNATQMTFLGDKVDPKMKILLGTKASTLSTNIKFEHTFLTVKFQWMIRQTPQDYTTTPSSLESSSTEDSDHNISSATESPKGSPKSLGNASTTSKPKPPTHKPPVPQHGSTIAPQILKLNTHTIDDKGHRVIEIAIDSGIIAPVVPASTNSNTNAKVLIRKKRGLNSEEISQIHKILALTKTSKSKQEPATKDTKDAKEDELKKIVEVGQIEGTGTEGEDQLPKKIIPYETWKASIDKKYRPPGFYVNVDDQVVFDNWIGVWQTPTVMGRSLAPTPKDWNETTVMLQFDEKPDQNIKINFEWEPTNPSAYLLLSNITISTFAARPNASKVNETVKDHSADHDHHQNITLYIVLKSQDEKPKEPFQNTTAPPPTTTTPSLTFVTPSVTDSKNVTTKTIPPLTTDGMKKTSIVTGNGIIDNGLPEVRKIEVEKPPQRQKPQKDNDQNHSNTGLIVACVTGGLFSVILVFLLQKKMKLSRKNIRGC